MLVLTLALAVVVGISLGLLGGGGSILTVPLLVYVAGQDTKVAIATSLVVVGVTSAAGVVAHARAGRVQWRTGLIFGAAGMIGAYGGGRLGSHVPDTLLLVAFGLMMAVTSVAMLRGRRAAAVSTPPQSGRRRLVLTILEGMAVGAVTGLVGAGGGFVVVPALALLGGLPMPQAIGTSLLVITMKSGAALAGYLSAVSIDWGLAAAVVVAAVAGSVIGGRLVDRVAPDVLRRAFGWFVVVMAAFILVQQVPAGVRAPLALAAAATTLVAVAVVRRRSAHSQAADPVERGGEIDGADLGETPSASIVEGVQPVG